MKYTVSSRELLMNGRDDEYYEELKLLYPADRMAFYTRKNPGRFERTKFTSIRYTDYRRTTE